MSCQKQKDVNLICVSEQGTFTSVIFGNILSAYSLVDISAMRAGDSLSKSGSQTLVLDSSL